MENVYDFIDWGFVGFLFDKMGFGERWRKWIKVCIEGSSYSILVNGSPLDPIDANRGLTQGDPLSLFIFSLLGDGRMV